MSRNIEKVKHISERMAKFCTVLIGVIPVFLVWCWVDHEAARNFGFFHRVPYPIDPPSTASLFGGFLISAALGALVVGGLYHLRQFFKLCTEGDLFTPDGARSLHKFSIYMVLYAFLALPGETALGLIMTINNPVGERMLTASFQTYDITVIFLSLVVFAISWVYRESVEVSHENKQFV